MFFALAKQDSVLITAFVTLLFTLFILIFVFITKTLPTGRGGLDLNRKGFFIVVGMHLVLFCFCAIMTIYRSTTIDHFIKKGLITIACIKEIDTKPKKLHFLYSYKIENGMYLGKTIVYVTKEFPNYNIGEEIIILVDPDDFKKSLFVRIRNISS